MKVVYPGTFDPFTLGHLDLALRAQTIYGHVTVAISENLHKHPMFSLDDRIEMAKQALAGNENVSVVGFQGLLVDLMSSLGISLVLRGIRGMVDFEYEFQMAQVNRAMLPGFESIFLMPGENYMVLSSTFIRDLLRHGGDVSKFLPEPVYNYITTIQGRQL